MYVPEAKVILPNEDIVEIIKEYKKSRDPELLEKVIFNNVRIINQIISESFSNFDDKEDLFNQGVIAIISAIDAFDEGKNVWFSKYVQFWIRGKLLTYIRDDIGYMRLPAHLYGKINRLNEIIEDYKESKGRSPKYEELTSCTDFTESELKVLLNLQQREFLSLNAGSEDCEASFEQVIPSSEDVIDDVDRREKIDLMLNGLDALPEREALILRDRYGLNEENKSLTLAEIGGKLNITMERVRQLENIAKKKMRKILSKKIYEDITYN